MYNMKFLLTFFCLAVKYNSGNVEEICDIILQFSNSYRIKQEIYIAEYIEGTKNLVCLHGRLSQFRIRY